MHFRGIWHAKHDAVSSRTVYCLGVVARDGIEPPLPAFSGLLSTIGLVKSRPDQPAAKRSPERSRRAPSLRSLPRPALQDLLSMDHDQRQKRRDQRNHHGPDKRHVTVLPTLLHVHLRLAFDDHVTRRLQVF